jgi:hypothetical protein
MKSQKLTWWGLMVYRGTWESCGPVGETGSGQESRQWKGGQVDEKKVLGSAECERSGWGFQTQFEF